ncbi:MAG: hypothetical protein IT460_17715 [Planctomycetes bacterium]|nr:hypothetical protein [Planctomycetota bacterium]
MQATADPNPVQPGATYTVTPSGGTEPYAFVLPGPPANPPGLTMTVSGGVATIQVPEGIPSGTALRVRVVDASVPPQHAVALNSVA